MISFEDQIIRLKEESIPIKEEIDLPGQIISDDELLEKVNPLFEQISEISQEYQTNFRAAKIYINDAIVTVLNRTLLKKHRLLKLKKNNFQFAGALKTLENTFSFVEKWESKIVGLEWYDLAKLFANHDCYISTDRRDDGFELLDKIRAKLDGQQNYYIEDTWNKLIEMPENQFYNRIELQYNFWTLPNLEKGNTLLMPDVILEHEFGGHKIQRNGGEYYNCFGLLSEYLQGIAPDKEKFDSVYEGLLHKDKLSEVIEKFSQEWFINNR